MKQLNRWAVLGSAEPKIQPSGRKVPMIQARCECGTVARLDPRIIRRGNSKSCGCLRDELARERMTKTL